MPRGEKARVTGEGQKNGMTPDDIPDGFVSWEEYNLGWGKWNIRDRSGHSANEVEEMGGFSYRHLAELLGHNPVSWELQDKIRYAQFELKPEDRPIDLTKPQIVIEDPPRRSHIRDSFERAICNSFDDAPDGNFFFDAAEGDRCTKCLTKMHTWLNWWVDAGRKKD